MVIIQVRVSVEPQHLTMAGQTVYSAFQMGAGLET